MSQNFYCGEIYNEAVDLCTLLACIIIDSFLAHCLFVVLYFCTGVNVSWKENWLLLNLKQLAGALRKMKAQRYDWIFFYEVPELNSDWKCWKFPQIFLVSIITFSKKNKKALNFIGNHFEWQTVDKCKTVLLAIAEVKFYSHLVFRLVLIPGPGHIHNETCFYMWLYNAQMKHTWRLSNHNQGQQWIAKW